MYFIGLFLNTCMTLDIRLVMGGEKWVQILLFDQKIEKPQH